LISQFAQCGFAHSVLQPAQTPTRAVGSCIIERRGSGEGSSGRGVVIAAMEAAAATTASASDEARAATARLNGCGGHAGEPRLLLPLLTAVDGVLVWQPAAGRELRCQRQVVRQRARAVSV
jgi:hypothetical protein